MTRESVRWLQRRALWVAVPAAAIAASGCANQVPTSTPHQTSNSPLAKCDANVRPAGIFDHPPACPGYAWCFSGHGVRGQVVTSAAGPAHCGWETATLLTVGWPPGTYSETAAHARQYVRDPLRVTNTPFLQESLALQVPLPVDAAPTGLRFRGVEIYVRPADGGRAVYVVGGGVTERWPRSDPMTLCVWLLVTPSRSRCPPLGRVISRFSSWGRRCSQVAADGRPSSGATRLRPPSRQGTRVAVHGGVKTARSGGRQLRLGQTCDCSTAISVGRLSRIVAQSKRCSTARQNSPNDSCCSAQVLNRPSPRRSSSGGK